MCYTSVTTTDEVIIDRVNAYEVSFAKSFNEAYATKLLAYAYEVSFAKSFNEAYATKLLGG
jgi:hypothetical protein